MRSPSFSFFTFPQGYTCRKKECLLYFMRKFPLLHIDALRYIREGIRVTYADYPHQPCQAFQSLVLGIRIFSIRANIIET